MKKRVTLNLSDDILQRALEIAARSQRELEDVLEEWIDRYADDLPVDTLSDDELMRLIAFEMNIIQKQELRNLLYAHRVRKLTDEESIRMDNLLQIYRRGIVRRAKAMEIAIARGLVDEDDSTF